MVPDLLVLRDINMDQVDLGADLLHLEETNMDLARAAAANRARREGTMEMVQDHLEVVPLEASMEVEDLLEVDLLVTRDTKDLLDKVRRTVCRNPLGVLDSCRRLTATSLATITLKGH